MVELKHEDFGVVRMTKNELNDDVYVAKDISEMLKYRKSLTSDMTKPLHTSEKEFMKVKTNGGLQKMQVVNKDGLFRILVSTRKINKDKKEKIYKWLTGYSFDQNMTSCKEAEFIDILSEVLLGFGIHADSIIKQYPVLDYRIDLYIDSLNVAIEYDENSHKNYTFKEHIGRQIKIENELGCKFIRVSNSNSNLYNVGYILKQLFKSKYILN